MSQITLTTQQEHLDSIYYRWKSQYNNSSNPKHINIANRLKALELPIDKSTIDKIIGNDSWTDLKCDICNKYADMIFHIRPIAYDPYENPGVDICKNCITELNTLVKDNS